MVINLTSKRSRVTVERTWQGSRSHFETGQIQYILRKVGSNVFVYDIGVTSPRYTLYLYSEQDLN